MTPISSVDWMILLLFLFFTISVGLGLKESMTGSREFFVAGRSLPGWLCGLAFTGASLGSLEVLGMGAAGARYGLSSAAFFGLGSVLPLLFAALYIVPVYYRSKARSIPEYLGMRFDAKTRGLAAIFSAIGSILAAAVAVYIMARISASLQLFDIVFHADKLGSRGVLLLASCIFCGVVLLYVVLGGLAAAMYTQVMQFFLLLAGFLPVVYFGLSEAGGWGKMRAAFTTAASSRPWLTGHTGGFGALLLAIAIGCLLTSGYWFTDLSVLQTTFAAENINAARRAPLLAAALRAVLPFLLIVPGVIAIGLPTPQTSVVVHNDNGSIVREIYVVPQAQENGHGVVPARTNSIVDPMYGKVLHDPAGHTELDYGAATPQLIAHDVPTGLLGLALTALFACLTTVVAGRIAAFNTIFTCDIYRIWLRKDAPDRHYMIVGRWVALAAVVVTVLLAWLGLRMASGPGALDLLLISFALLNAPMLATLLLAIFWKRTTGAGAFAGLLLGILAAVAHYGLTLPTGADRGLAGGWIVPMHHPASALAQNVGAALLAILVNCIVTIVVSLRTPCPDQAAVAALAYKPTAPPRNVKGWKRPAFVATMILVLSIVVTAILA